MAALTVEEFEQHFKNLYKPLCLFALRYTEQTDEAEDIVQQVFTDVWEKNRTEQGTIGNLKAYLFRAVRNRSLSYAARPDRLTATDQIPEQEDLSEEEQMDEAQRDARLWEAIDRLPPERKKIFLLSKRDGMKYREIADELHLSVKTVENQIGKALKSLRETAVHIYTFFFGPL